MDEKKISELDSEISKIKQTIADLDKSHAVTNVTLKHMVELHENLLGAIKEQTQTMGSIQMSMKEMQLEIKSGIEKTSSLEKTVATIKSGAIEIGELRNRINTIEDNNKETFKRAFDKIDKTESIVKEIEEGMEINIVKVFKSGIILFLTGTIGVIVGYFAQIFVTK